jgi:hypothetical protein
LHLRSLVPKMGSPRISLAPLDELRSACKNAGLSTSCPLGTQHTQICIFATHPVRSRVLWRGSSSAGDTDLLFGLPECRSSERSGEIEQALDCRNRGKAGALEGWSIRPSRKRDNNGGGREHCPRFRCRSCPQRPARRSRRSVDLIRTTQKD